MTRSNRTALRSTVLSVALALSFAAPAAIAAPRLNEGNMARGGLYDSFIVRYRKSSPERGNAALRQKALDAAGKAHGVRVGHVRRLALGADVIHTDHPLDAAAAKKFMLSFRRDPHVEYIEVDAVLRPMLSPDDPQYAAQWHYSDATAGIRAPAAWDIATGDGVVVAVIDTGITAHSDLNANVVAGYDFITDTTRANDGDGRDDNPSDPGDWVAENQCGTHAARNSSWHGTHVGGTIAAVTNNTLGVAGVAFDAKIMPVRTLGTCGGLSSDSADAIVWAAGGTVGSIPVNTNPVEVINMSLGGTGTCGTTTQDAINFAVSQGVVVVVSAGNNNADASTQQPANCNNVITVGAVGRTGARASYSNYGSTVDIAAPGGDFPDYILSTINAGTTGPGAESYASYQGTSMAAPHVAGVVALMQSLTVNTPSTVEAIVKASARDFPVACPLGCGAGLIDAPDALAAASGPLLSVSGPAPAAEGDSGTHSVDFTVSLSEAAASDVTFDITTVDGTATAGSDYVAKSTAGVTITAGLTSATFSVDVNGDTTIEGAEAFGVTVSNVAGAATLIGATASATLVNDDFTLANNVPVTGLSGAAGTQTVFTLAVPVNASNLVFATSGGSGDADLYVKAGSPPTLASFDCKSETVTTAESCTIASPSTGTYHAMVHGFTAYSGVTLVGHYDLPTLNIGNATVVEGNSGTRTVTFTVTLSSAQAAAVSFDAATANATSMAPADYVALSSPGLTIPAGQTTKAFTVTVNGDATVEPNEVFYVNLSNPVNAAISDGQATGLIYNDDGPTLSIADTSVAEGLSGTKLITFTVSLSQVAAVPVTYTATTSNGTASVGSDYVAKTLAGETIPAGTLSRTFTVTVNGDSSVEPNEVLYVTLSAVTGVSVLDSLGAGTILNDDGPTLAIANATVVEGNSGVKAINFIVSLSQSVAGPVTFNIATANGSALSGSDYVARALIGQTIAAGELSKTFTVAVNGDTAVEANESFVVNLSAVTGASLLDNQGSGVIYNDDGPTLSIADVAVTEGNAGTKSMVFTVALSQAAAVPVTYNIATANSTANAADYVANSATGESITPGMLSKTFTVTLNGDTTAEQNENFFVTLTAPVGATLLDNQAIGTLLNDDGPTLSIANRTIVEGNAGTQALVFTVSLSEAAAGLVTFDIETASGGATSGTDFVANAQEASIDAGQLSTTFTVQVNGDAAVEANEVFYVNLSGASGASILDNQATGLIYNDDGPTLSISDANVTEGNAGTKIMTFTVSLSQAAAGPVTYTVGTANYTASAGTDYVATTLPGQTIAAGNLSKTFDVTINGDTAVEGHESFFVVLSAATGASVLDSQGAGLIVNDD